MVPNAIPHPPKVFLYALRAQSVLTIAIINFPSLNTPLPHHLSAWTTNAVVCFEDSLPDQTHENAAVSTPMPSLTHL